MSENLSSYPTKKIPEICPEASREGDHFRCKASPLGCVQINAPEKYICPCFGKNFGGWIPVSDDKVEEMKLDIYSWNRRRLRMPLKDDYRLIDCEFFRVYSEEFLVERFHESDREQVTKEMVSLFDNGDKIGFNTDYGVGNILRDDDGKFTVEKYVYGGRSLPVEAGSIDEVLDFLSDFMGEPYDW